MAERRTAKSAMARSRRARFRRWPIDRMGVHINCCHQLSASKGLRDTSLWVVKERVVYRLLTPLGPSSCQQAMAIAVPRILSSRHRYARVRRTGLGDGAPNKHSGVALNRESVGRTLHLGCKSPILGALGGVLGHLVQARELPVSPAVAASWRSRDLPVKSHAPPFPGRRHEFGLFRSCAHR